MKAKIIGSLLFIAFAALLIIGSYRPARAAQYDVAYPIRTGTSGGISLPATGTNGAWQTLNTGSSGYLVQTTGSGLAATGTAPGTVFVSSSNTLEIIGTNGVARNVP